MTYPTCPWFPKVLIILTPKAKTLFTIRGGVSYHEIYFFFGLVCTHISLIACGFFESYTLLTDVLSLHNSLTGFLKKCTKYRPQVVIIVWHDDINRPVSMTNCHRRQPSFILSVYEQSSYWCQSSFKKSDETGRMLYIGCSEVRQIFTYIPIQSRQKKKKKKKKRIHIYIYTFINIQILLH